MTAEDSAAAFVSAEELRLTCLVDTIIPADDYPSASAAGGLRFLRRLLHERPDWVERVAAVLSLVDSTGRDAGDLGFSELDSARRVALLDELADDADYRWFADLVNAGYYADPDNGGNDGALSWSMVRWRPWPDASRRPTVAAPPTSHRTIEP